MAWHAVAHPGIREVHIAAGVAHNVPVRLRLSDTSCGATAL
jgi:hypothetical protein